MPIETATYISDLVPSNPAGSDPLFTSDDHVRLIKGALKNTFPGITGALTSSTGAMVLTDGTATAPAYSFASEATLGFYRTSPGNIATSGALIGSVPIGGRIDWFGTDATLPSWLLPCDGQAVSRTTYAALFAAIGTTWGAGDGSTTFNVPNLLDRFTRHRNTASGNKAGAVGTTQGSQNLTHTHDVSGTTANETQTHTHQFVGTTASMNRNQTHTHSISPSAFTTLNVSNGSGVGGGGAFGPNITASIGAANVDHEHAFSGTTSTQQQAHNHPFSATTGNGSADGAEARPLSATVLTCIRAL